MHSPPQVRVCVCVCVRRPRQPGNSPPNQAPNSPATPVLLSPSFDSCSAFAANAVNLVGDTVYKGDLSNVGKWGVDLHMAEFENQLLGKSAVGCFVNR